jgi:hypothetical protein
MLELSRIREAPGLETLTKYFRGFLQYLLENFGTVKVKLSLYLTKYHAMKTDWGSGGIAPRILDLGTRWRRVILGK